jgi:hypothetical protein
MFGPRVGVKDYVDRTGTVGNAQAHDDFGRASDDKGTTAPRVWVRGRGL